MVIIKSKSKENLSKVAAILVLSSTPFAYEVCESQLILSDAATYTVYIDLLTKGFDADLFHSETIILS